MVWRAFLVIFISGLTIPARSATFTVQEQDFVFSPPNQTVSVGDTITWNNVGAIVHTTTSGTSGTPDGLWDSGTMNPGASFSFTFNVPAATYPYYCTFHYTIGMVGSVTVQGAHVPPSVSITSPANGATFPAGSAITVQASASSTDGTVTRVDFFENGNLFGSATAAPYSATFSGGAPGPYALTAVATDNQGATSTSTAVNVTIQPTTGGPTVAITSPTDGQVFPAGTNILVQATASETGGTITQVQFFANNISIGTVTTPPYEVTLASAASGSYALTAKATDNMGATATSPAVNITVQSTNGGPIVTITNPLNGQTFPPGTNILIHASASDNTGTITQVQFFTNNVSIGTVTNPPYDFLLTSVATGSYALKATATDNNGAVATSPLVNITVGGAQTNLPPTVAITEPTNGARFPANATITVSASANANAPGSQISKVEFFLGTNSVGVIFAGPFQISLSNLLPGSYRLTAKATDSHGGTATSSAVSFTVFGPPTVVLTKPATNSAFPVGNNVILIATVSTTGQKVDHVEFLVNGSVIGQATSTNNLYTAIWVPTAPGVFSLTAVAVDEFGQSGSSTPVLVRAFVPESTRPTIKITKAPPNNSRQTTGTVHIFGTAQNKIGIDHVQFQVNGGAFHFAVGTNSWQADVTLTPGKNAIGLQSVDLAGNTSVAVFRYYTYVVEVPLTVNIFGPGSVKPDLNGKSLQIGSVYHVTAIPNPQALFTGWTGAVSSASAQLSFQMQSNLVLNATFVPNPFIAVAGEYAGLVLNSNAPFPANSGFLTLQLAKSGTFSGKLAIAGASYSFHDRFNVSGSDKVPVMRPGLPPVTLTMQLDLTNNSNTLTGIATDGSWVSPLFAARNVFNATTAPATQAGVSHFALQRTPDDGGAVFGQATARIGLIGDVLINGKVTNGPAFSQATALSQDGDFPFYVSLSHGVEVVIGVLNASGSPAAVTGSVFWSKAETNGFSTTLVAAPGP
jgi:plastocyanin